MDGTVLLSPASKLLGASLYQVALELSKVTVESRVTSHVQTCMLGITWFRERCGSVTLLCLLDTSGSSELEPVLQGSCWWVSTAPFSSPAFSFSLSNHGVRTSEVSHSLHVWLVTAVSSAAARTELCGFLRTTCKESTNQSCSAQRSFELSLKPCQKWRICISLDAPTHLNPTGKFLGSQARTYLPAGLSQPQGCPRSAGMLREGQRF